MVNGLTLRVSGTGKNKMKTSQTFDPVLVPEKFTHPLKSKHGMFKNFFNSTAEEQLKILKKLSYMSIDEDDLKQSDVMEFLAVVYLNSESKHPVQCCVMRYIIKNEALHKPFTQAIIQLIQLRLAKQHNTYNCYQDAVYQLSSCIDNLPGGEAIKSLEVKLTEYLNNCLTCCVTTLREQSLSPTEKNEIFSLVHTTFRILLFIVQKLSNNSQDCMDCIVKSIESCINYVLQYLDTPMDTKSVGGILYVTLYVMENGSDSWKAIIHPADDSKVQEIMKHESARLSLLSGVSTVVPVETLYSTIIDDESAMLTLTKHILAIGDRMTSDPVLLLGVTRTLTQVSKSLPRSGAWGPPLVDALLPFVWAHMEHYMDSVGHLCAQALGHITGHCVQLNRHGDSGPMDRLFSALSVLDPGRKSYHVCVGALARAAGARAVLTRLPTALSLAVRALALQPVQASAASSLEALLQGAEVKTWAELLALVGEGCLEPAALGLLRRLLARAAEADPHLVRCITEHARRACDVPELRGEELRRALVLMGVARRCGALPATTPGHAPTGGRESWRGVLGYDVLRRAALEPQDEIRILSLSLVVESPKSSEALTAGELRWVLWFLRHNVNAQAPSFRQATLSLLKKLMNRLEESYGALTRRGLPADHYGVFLRGLRALALRHLLPGANYGRRHAALQALLWSEGVLQGHDRCWKEEYVEKLLLHLEDSYENNKALALQLLMNCPQEMLEKQYSTSLQFSDVLAQASSARPADCVSAAYKLELMLQRLPHRVPGPPPDTSGGAPEVVRERAAREVLSAARAQLTRLRQGLARAARDAPLHGLLHCLRRLLEVHGDSALLRELPENPLWKDLVEEVIDTCLEVTEVVGSVVNSASPEGHLPMDATPMSDGHGDIQLEDGRHVTAQMVLLCAWRSVKEVSLILGHIVSKVRRPGEPGHISVERVRQVGAHFTSLLAELKHRGAFEQAYVGFTTMLSSLWQHPVAELRALPGAWLDGLMMSIASDPRLCPTRRSAGLPFMIQALVTTELAAGGGRRFDACARHLVQLARTGESVDARVHCANVVRALFRCAALRDQLPPHAPPALLLALHGFNAPGWSERNSSTLLFSALMVWIFGVQRSKDSENLCTRNRMTGRIFFLRFPELYDYMLNTLEQANSDSATPLSGSLHPVLLLLARLYPSALEGTVSNFKVSRFLPLVRGRGRSAALLTRRLAARALEPLVTPDTYVSVLQEMLECVCDPRVPTNYCHGTLLQLTKLVESRLAEHSIDDRSLRRLGALLRDSTWVLRQAAGAAPCYVLAHDYLHLLNSLLWRLPTLMNTELLQEIQTQTHNLLFVADKHIYHPGLQLALANSAYLHLVILLTLDRTDDIPRFIHACLTHDTYEVVLSALNFLLIVYRKFETENKFQEHLRDLCEKSNFKLEIAEGMCEDLCDILKSNEYLECQQKALQVLTLRERTQTYIIRGKCKEVDTTDGAIVDTLIELIENEHENSTHSYLQSLASFVSTKIRELDEKKLLEVVRMVFACSSSDNSEDTRAVVLEFLERNCQILLELNLSSLEDDEKFEFRATVYCMLVMMLEDEEAWLRARAAGVVCSVVRVHGEGAKDRARRDAQDGTEHTQEVDTGVAVYGVIPSWAGCLLREHVSRACDSVGLLTVMALLNFRCTVQLTDEINDECRVFDQNERYNAFFEETIWTRDCVETIKRISNVESEEPAAFVSRLAQTPRYGATLQRLCGDNVGGVVEEHAHRTDVNPKLQVFVDVFLEISCDESYE